MSCDGRNVDILDLAIRDPLKQIAQRVSYAQAVVGLGLEPMGWAELRSSCYGIGADCEHPRVPSAALVDGGTKAPAQREQRSP